MAIQSVVCIVDSCAHADVLIDRLRTAGFLRADVSLLLADRESLSFSGDTGESDESQNGEALATALTWLGVIASFRVPGVGAFLGTGPIMVSMPDAESGAPVGIARALMSFGFTKHESTRYEGRIRHGALLIGVQADQPEEACRAQLIFEAGNADAIATVTSHGERREWTARWNPVTIGREQEADLDWAETFSALSWNRVSTPSN